MFASSGLRVTLPKEDRGICSLLGLFKRSKEAIAFNWLRLAADSRTLTGNSSVASKIDPPELPSKVDCSCWAIARRSKPARRTSSSSRSNSSWGLTSARLARE